MLSLISGKSHDIFEKYFGNLFAKEGFIKYFLNIQWISFARIFVIAISLVTTMVMARILGPIGFGLFSYVLSIVGLFGILATFGIDNIVYKEIVRNKHKRLEILGSALFLKTITGLVAFLCVVTMVYFSTETAYVKKIMLIFGLSFITQPLLLLGYDFLKDSDAKPVAITQIITAMASNLSKIFVVYFYQSIAGLIIILVLENIASGLLYLLQIRVLKGRSMHFSISPAVMNLIFKAAAPLVLFSAFSEIYARIDQVMLRYYLDVTAVGIYSAAVKLTEIWYVVPNILLGALTPALINAFSDQKEYEKRITFFYRVLIVASFSISVLVFFASGIIASFVYGDKFIGTSTVLSIYIFSLFGSFLSNLIFQDLLIKGKNKQIILLPLLTALLNIALNIFLIPTKGVVGAALATVISYNLLPFLYLLFTKYKKA